LPNTSVRINNLNNELRTFIKICFQVIDGSDSCIVLNFCPEGATFLAGGMGGPIAGSATGTGKHLPRRYKEKGGSKVQKDEP